MNKLLVALLLLPLWANAATVDSGDAAGSDRRCDPPAVARNITDVPVANGATIDWWMRWGLAGGACPQDKMVSWTATGLPVGVEINELSGRITGTLDAASDDLELNASVTLNTVDGSATDPFTITIGTPGGGAPVLSSPDVPSSTITATTAQVQAVTTIGEGGFYCVATTTVTYPGDSTVLAATPTPISETGLVSFNLTGLTAGTATWAHCIQRVGTSNDSNSFTEAFTTASSTLARYTQTDGLITIPAEDEHGNSGATTNTQPDPDEVNTWTILSGGDGFQSLPETNSFITTGFTGSSPRLDYDINAASVTSGELRFCVNAGATTSQQDSLHMGIDGLAVAELTSIILPGFGGGPVWQCQNAPITTGDHTINVWMREAGVKIYEIRLSTDLNYNPVGGAPTGETLVEGGLDRYVCSSGGSNSASGNSDSTCWASESYAMTNAPAGSRVWFEVGYVGGQLTMTLDGDASDLFTVGAYYMDAGTPKRATRDPQNPSQLLQGSKPVFKGNFSESCYNGAMNACPIDHANAVPSSVYQGICQMFGEYQRLENVACIQSAGLGVETLVEPIIFGGGPGNWVTPLQARLEIEGVTVEEVASTGIQFYQVQNSVIRNNYTQKTNIAPWLVKENRTPQGTGEFEYFTKTAGASISLIGSPDSYSVIDNNLVDGSHGEGINVNRSAYVAIRFNRVSNHNSSLYYANHGSNILMEGNIGVGNDYRGDSRDFHADIGDWAGDAWTQWKFHHLPSSFPGTFSPADSYDGFSAASEETFASQPLWQEPQYFLKTHVFRNNFMFGGNNCMGLSNISATASNRGETQSVDAFANGCFGQKSVAFENQTAGGATGGLGAQRYIDNIVQDGPEGSNEAGGTTGDGQCELMVGTGESTSVQNNLFRQTVTDSTCQDASNVVGDALIPIVTVAGVFDALTAQLIDRNTVLTISDMTPPSGSPARTLTRTDRSAQHPNLQLVDWPGLQALLAPAQLNPGQTHNGTWDSTENSRDFNGATCTTNDWVGPICR